MLDTARSFQSSNGHAYQFAGAKRPARKVASTQNSERTNQGDRMKKTVTSHSVKTGKAPWGSTFMNLSHSSLLQGSPAGEKMVTVFAIAGFAVNKLSQLFGIK